MIGKDESNGITILSTQNTRNSKALKSFSFMAIGNVSVQLRDHASYGGERRRGNEED